MLFHVTAGFPKAPRPAASPPSALRRRKKPPFQDDGSEPTIELAKLISVMPSVAVEVWPTHRRPQCLDSSHQALWRMSRVLVSPPARSVNWLRLPELA